MSPRRRLGRITAAGLVTVTALLVAPGAASAAPEATVEIQPAATAPTLDLVVDPASAGSSTPELKPAVA
jgi:hypothetical protein